MENIERHYHEAGADVHEAVVGGTQEVMLAIFSGTYATVMVLLPIVYIGGFVQTVLRPLSISLVIALVASYVVSVTVIPLLAPYLLRRREGAGRNRFEGLVYRFNELVVDPIRDFYVHLTAVALRHRAAFLVVGLALLVASAGQMPLVGRDLMPPMDTGIVKINFETDANTSLGQTESVLARMEQMIFERPEVESVSSLIGSEPAVISFGAGRLPQQIADLVFGRTDAGNVGRRRKAGCQNFLQRIGGAFLGGATGTIRTGKVRRFEADQPG